MQIIWHWLLQIQVLVFQMMTWSAFLSGSIVPIPRGREHTVGLGWDSLLCATWSMLWEDRLRLRVRLARGAVSVCCCILLCRVLCDCKGCSFCVRRRMLWQRY